MKVKLAALDVLFIAMSIPLAVGAVIAAVLMPTWQLAVVAACMCLVSACIFLSRRRRRQAFAMRAADTGDSTVGRAAAKVHLQELALLLVAIALLFAAGGAMSMLA